MSAARSEIIQVFYCYAEKDKGLFQELENHLSPLKRLQQIAGWRAFEIQAGKDRTCELEMHLNAADLILLLISPDFIASDLCYSLQMQKALENHQSGNAVVVPILLRPVLWDKTPLASLQILPKGARPITLWRNRDEAFLHVALEIVSIVEHIITEKKARDSLLKQFVIEMAQRERIGNHNGISRDADAEQWKNLLLAERLYHKMLNELQGLQNTYIVENHSSREELTRLLFQEQMATRGMGGVLPEQPDVATFRRVLDVACGPGGWLIETAQTYPTMVQLIGVDVSAIMIAYARQQAKARHMSDQVQFFTMDALHKLDFPDDHFDLVNQRSATSYLHIWNWPDLLLEMKRIARVGGVVRLTEPCPAPESNSQIFNLLMNLVIEALYLSGRLFTPERGSVLEKLPGLMRRAGFLHVQTYDYTVEYRPGTPEGELALENTRIGFRTFLPFLCKWTQVPTNFEAISQQALNEMQKPDFVAIWKIRTVWGNVPAHLSRGTT